MKAPPTLQARDHLKRAIERAERAEHAKLEVEARISNESESAIRSREESEVAAAARVKAERLLAVCEDERASAAEDAERAREAAAEALARAEREAKAAAEAREAASELQRR